MMSIEKAISLIPGYWRITHIEELIKGSNRWSVCLTNNSYNPKEYVYSVELSLALAIAVATGRAQRTDDQHNLNKEQGGTKITIDI